MLTERALFFSLGVSAAVFAIISFVLILAYLDWEWQFDDKHHLLGFFALLLLFIQPIIGFFADRYYKPDRTFVCYSYCRVMSSFFLTLLN